MAAPETPPDLDPPSQPEPLDIEDVTWGTPGEDNLLYYNIRGYGMI